jgi:hypothetical protein
MADNINEKLKELTKDVLTEESLGEIAEAFNAAVTERAQLQVESALAQQDEDHAGKVKNLLEAIDQDHTSKLEKLVEAIDSNHLDKLKNVISKYETVLGEEANNFKNNMIANISNYLDLYLEDVVPAQSIKEAADNKKSEELLALIREKLGIDLALAQGSIKDAIIDGKKQIDEANKSAGETFQENADLKLRLNRVEAELILERKTVGMPEVKRKHMYKVLSDKSAQFINENFDYTVNLYEKGSDEAAELIKEEAQTTAHAVDTPSEEVIEEAANPQAGEGNSDEWSDSPFRSTYMDELRRF